ncbi:MAG: hypothetical protein U1B80_00695 [Anaerolineaceae bacterium]|nr:hypothetical protein [Anaerolineaceae bacterium]
MRETHPGMMPADAGMKGLLGGMTPGFRHLMGDVCSFAERASGLRLRSYQRAVARGVTASVLRGEGLSLVVMFPRQSGKNELQAQIEAYLLALYGSRQAEIVKISPTWRPQSLNAMRRLQRVLERNLVTKSLWRKENGYIYRIGSARVFFLSGATAANIVGATASTLLQVDEAQDVAIDKYDRDIAPMAAATNATRVFWGTAWTGRTLLARELQQAQAAEQADGMRRVFALTADEVATEVPAYGRFVASQVARFGRSHPIVRTQFFSEAIDAEGSMFPPGRKELMAGAHPRLDAPEPGRVYALLLDLAGEDEDLNRAHPGATPERAAGSRRDATALTVVELDFSTLADELLYAPTYRVVHRRQWVGVKHSRLYGELRALAEAWRSRHVVVDATGVGAGMASFLERALPGKVIPFIFNQASKSRLGWDFLAVVDSGRYREHAGVGDELQAAFWRQAAFCEYEALPGTEKILRWGVPDGRRDPVNGAYVHDDLLVSAALCAVLDRRQWRRESGAPLVVPGRDPLAELDIGF